MDTARGEGAANERPVRLHEAERAHDRDVLADRLVNQVDLLQHAIDHLGAVASTDEQLLDPWPEDATLDLQLRASFVALRVDHPDAAAGHRNVVDVGPRPWDTPVVPNGERGRGKAVQANAK